MSRSRKSWILARDSNSGQGMIYFRLFCNNSPFTVCSPHDAMRWGTQKEALNYRIEKSALRDFKVQPLRW